MSNLIFEVVQADSQAAWQDLGRKHSFQHGVTEGGAMDIHAAMWANRLLDRDAGDPLIEIAFGLFEIVFKSRCQISITGADLAASLDDQPIAPWRSCTVKPGMHLKFRQPQRGLRAYLAIATEPTLDSFYDSVSIVAREPFMGGKLRAGDTISGLVNDPVDYFQTTPERFIPDYRQPLTLELIPAYQFDQFPKTSIEQLTNGEYQIQNNSSRMAYLLGGQAIRHETQSLLSEGIAYGAVQIPPDGQPVVLLNDRQTMGGYPKVGCISRLSGTALSQRAYPSTVRFKTISAEAARLEYSKHLAFFSRR